MILESVFEVLLRIVGYIILEVFLQIICYSIGYAFLKLLTLGRFPRLYIPKGSAENQENYVIAIGLVVVILPVVYIASVYGS